MSLTGERAEEAHDKFYADAKKKKSVGDHFISLVLGPVKKEQK